MGAGVVSVALAVVWGQLLSATRHGLPTPTTWRTLVSRFEAAGSVIRSHPTPVPATPPVVLCIATGAGLVAALGGVAVGRARDEARRRAGGARPELRPVLLHGPAQLTGRPGRGRRVLRGGCARVRGRRRPRHRARSRWERVDTAPGRGRRWAGTVLSTLPAVGVGALAVVVPLAVSPALVTLKVDALPFPQPPASATPGLGLATGGGTDGLGGNGGGGGPGVLGRAGHRPRRQPAGRPRQPHRRGHVQRPERRPDVLAGGRAHRVRRHGVAPRPDHRGRGPELRPVARRAKRWRTSPPCPSRHPPRPSAPPITIGALESTLAPPAADHGVGRHGRRLRARLRRRPTRRSSPGRDLHGRGPGAGQPDGSGRDDGRRQDPRARCRPRPWRRT